MKKIGLVIQGPLLSIGRTGNKLHQTPGQLIAEGGVVHYDCRENIQRIINEFGSLFDEIVVSTWDNEVKEGDDFPGAKLISVPDPGGIKQAGHYKDNNKHRQFVSTLSGILELERSGIEVAVKIRTDVYLDLDKLLASFFAGEPEKIGATIVHPPNFLLHDLYFVAELSKLKGFCEAILAYDRFEFIPSVHREIVLKPAHVLYKEQIGVPDWAYFPNFPPDGVSSETRKIFDYMFQNVFFSLSPEVWRETLWRGTYFTEEHFSNLLSSREKRERRYDLPALITTDWKRYFHFRMEKSGAKIGPEEKLAALIGETGWKLWNLARKMVRYFL